MRRICTNKWLNHWTKLGRVCFQRDGKNGRPSYPVLALCVESPDVKLKYFEVTGDSRFRGSNEQMYPVLPWYIHWNGVVSMVRDPRALHVPRWRSPRFLSRLCSLAIRGRMKAATADVVSVLKSFPRQSQSVQFHEVQSGLVWYFPFLSNSTESMGIGISRSRKVASATWVLRASAQS